MKRQKPFSAWCYQAEEMRLLKLPFREEWGREIPLQTHLNEQLLKWKCCSSETFKFPPIAREERRQEAEEEQGLLSHTHPSGIHTGQHSLGSRICLGVNQDGTQHQYWEAGLKGNQICRGGRGMIEDSSI